MDIDFAFLCDYARVKGNTLDAFGLGINILVAKNVPVTHPALFLVVRLNAGVAEPVNKQVVLRLVDQTDSPVGSDLPSTQVTFGTGGSNSLVFGFQNLRFENYGSYRFQVFIDDDMPVELPLSVVPPRSEPEE